MKSDTEQTMRLEQLYKVGSDCELNSWPNSSVGQSVCTFKTHSGQLSISTSNNPSVVNNIPHIYIYIYIYIYNCFKLQYIYCHCFTLVSAKMKYFANLSLNDKSKLLEIIKKITRIQAKLQHYQGHTQNFVILCCPSKLLKYLPNVIEFVNKYFKCFFK